MAETEGRSRGRKTTHVTAEHGCTFWTRWTPTTLRGRTMDCPGTCGRLLLFPDDLGAGWRAVQALDFHEELHRRSGGAWPRDGAGTYSVEVGS